MNLTNAYPDFILFDSLYGVDLSARIRRNYPAGSVDSLGPQGPAIDRLVQQHPPREQP